MFVNPQSFKGSFKTLIFKGLFKLLPVISKFWSNFQCSLILEPFPMSVNHEVWEKSRNKSILISF